MPELNDDEPLEPLQELVYWEKRKRELNEQLKEVKAECVRCEEPAREHMVKTNTQRTTIDGLTVYLKRDFAAGREEGISEDELCDALLEAGPGWEEFVKQGANKNSLRARLKELDEDRDDPLAELDIPECLHGKLKVIDQIKAAVKAA